MKKYIRIILLYLLCLQQAYAQTDTTVTISKLQGIWKFKENDYESFMINIENKSLSLSYWCNDKSCYTYGFPFSYFGFWDSSQKDSPKKITQLDTSERVHQKVWGKLF